MNPFAHFRAEMVRIVGNLATAGLLPGELDVGRITVEPPRDPSHGDMSSNAAMVLARDAGLAPKVLAAQLADNLRLNPSVTEASIAGPGFINWRLADGFWHARLADILARGRAYGGSDRGRGRRINVEYVSANPTGPLHVGHARGAVFGDALATLLQKAGFEVCREYYINDAGSQVDVLARSTWLRYREALGDEIGTIPEGLYPGEYLKPVGQALAARDGARWLDRPEAEWLAPIRDFAIGRMLELIRSDLASLGIRPDVYTSERALHDTGAIDRVLEELTAADLVYTGVLDPPKGKLPDDWEPRPQTLFRATRFGDDVDRALRKSDGSWTYFAPDIAYHTDKIHRGFDELIDVLGADHGGYVRRMQAAVAAMSGGRVSLDVKICQLVHLFEAGVPFKMSKRAGTFVTLRDVVDEVGRDIVRFMMLTRRNDQTLEFDFAKVVEESRDNLVWYVQYAHARAQSVLRRAAEEFGAEATGLASLKLAELSHLDDPAELALLRLLAGWPRLIESAAEAHEPHRLAFFLNDVASAFHALWTKGKGETQLRFLVPEDRALSLARMALIQATAFVIASGLDVFGVTPLMEMR